MPQQQFNTPPVQHDNGPTDGNPPGPKRLTPIVWSNGSQSPPDTDVHVVRAPDAEPTVAELEALEHHAEEPEDEPEQRTKKPRATST